MKTNFPFKPRLLCLALGSIGLCGSVLAQSQSTEVGTVRITGSGEQWGNGLLVDDDGVKQRSTITREAIEKERPSANAFQLLNLMPGVNAYSYDATGLFGGNLRVRGFNSDQMGFTINGAPVNDSGNFAVYPQEYIDAENLCELFITQGSADTDAPHVGASGGNVGLVTCAPNDASGWKVGQSLGQLNFSRTFLRYDTGLFNRDTTPTKFFASYSKSKVDKFKGYGGADRDHVDLSLESQISGATKLTAAWLYNRAVNNNFFTPTKAEWLQNPNLEFTNVVPQNPASGSTNNNFNTSSVGSTPRTQTAYYGYALNPFENWLFTSRLQSRIDDKLTLSVEPYYWYGYGTGGVEQTTLTEAASASVSNALHGGIGDINKNGIYGDKVGVYSGSVTETHRPGFTFKADYNNDIHKILAGLWYENATHKQTKPATTVGNDGSIGDLWLRNNLITYNDGTPYEGRNWNTKSTAYSLFFFDTMALNPRTDLVFGLRNSSIQRDFTNIASSGTGSGADYNVNKTFSKLLGSVGLRYKIDDSWQAFGNITQNMRAPSNFALSGWVQSVSYTNGTPGNVTLYNDNQIAAETSTTTEAGVRYSGNDYKGSATVYHVDFKNRLASGYNPATATYTDYNVGDSTIDGMELQIGTKPIHHFSYFGSATYTKSVISNDFPTVTSGGTPTSVATSGMLFPDTPKWMYAVSAQYADGPYLAALTGKYTGTRYTTLKNDEWLDGYTVFDLNMGYRFPSGELMKNPTVRLNVSNLFNKNYLLANAGSGSNITPTIDTTIKYGGFPTYYVGAPRFVSVSFSSEF